MLPDWLTLLDGTEVISDTVVTKITRDPALVSDLQEQVAPEAILQGRRYYNHAEVLAFVAGTQGA